MFSFLKDTTNTISINQDNYALQAFKDETILRAALRLNLKYPHHCRVGACGRCKCRLFEGKVKQLTESAYVLSTEELKQGYILACQSIPKTAIQIEVAGMIQKHNKDDNM
jgi:3-phenylpropionate/trans-cinnamate dioxygenase ferredoxin reductase subunit